MGMYVCTSGYLHVYIMRLKFPLFGYKSMYTCTNGFLCMYMCI